MKTITIEAYTFDELNGAAQEQAIETERRIRVEAGYVPWSDEVIDSLKAAFVAMSGVRLTDYSIGGRGTHLKLSFDNDETAELSGRRAWAWIENNWLGDLRIPYKGKCRWELSGYGSGYRAGMIKPCPFTGVCFDDDIIDAVRNDIRDGCTIGTALYALANWAEKTIDEEYNDYLSDERIAEELRMNDFDFTIEGERI